MKRKLSIFLILVLLTNLITPLDFSDDVKINPYNKETNAFDFITNTPTVSTGIAFRTVGFKAYFTQNGQYYEVYFLSSNYDSEEYTKNNRTWVKNFFHVPLSPDNLIQNEGIPSIYEAFDTTYKESVDRVNIAEFFAKDNVIHLDAVFAKVMNNVPQGSISIGSNGELITDGTIWKTESEFLGSGIDWNSDTLAAVHRDYYGISLGFPPQPVGDPVPKINGTVDGVRAIRDIHTFNEGQTIDLDATDSTFPNKSMPLIYKWKYRKVGTSTWLPVIMSSSGTPFKNSLEVGEYEVELSTSAVCFRPWWNTSIEVPSKSPAKTRIVIKKNLKPLANAIVTSPPEIMLADTQNSVSIPVTLNTEILNVEQTDILSVELQLSTHEKDQKRSQFFYPSLKQTMIYNFTILYSGDPKTQIFEGKAIVTLKGGGVIESSIANCLTYLYKGKPINSNQPPVAIIKAPSETMVGSTYISGISSYDLDGSIVSYDFRIPSIGFYQSDTKSFCMPDLKWTGTYQVVLGVTDDDGARSETGAFIKVIPVPPNVEISSKGFYKENRKITLKATNWTEIASPVGENYNWTIKPMDVTSSQSNVKMVSTHGKQIDVLMKVKGKYLVTCTGTNTYGISDTETMILDVEEDKAPVMVIDSTNPQFRNNTRVAKITAYDHSYSTDGDFIKKRTWSYRFDSDNDGLFTDETSVALKSTNDYTDNAVDFNVNSVGKYEITLSDTETFGQETISQFITDSDYRVASKSIVVTVDNYAPKVNFYAANEKKIDLKIVTDYEGTDLLNLESKLNTLVSDGYEQFLNINYEVISDKKYLGRYIPEGASGYKLVEDQSTEKYKVATWAGNLTEYSDHTYETSYTTKYVYPEDQTYVTNSTFPARIKKAIAYNKTGAGAYLYLLENGQLYFMGSNSAAVGTSGDYWAHISMYATAPKLVATDVVDIQYWGFDFYDGNSQVEDNTGGDSEAVFILKQNGDLYVTGHHMYQNFDGQYVTPHPLHLTIPSELFGDNKGENNSMVGGYHDIGKVNDISNIDYLYVKEGTVVVHTQNNEWYGLGAKLNGFGYPTLMGRVSVFGTSFFQNYYWKVTVPSNDWGFDAQYFNYSSDFVKLDNLMKIDQDIGGIEKVEPFKAYGKNGKIYDFKIESNILLGIFDRNTFPSYEKYTYESNGCNFFRAFFPLQEYSPSVFTYSDSGKTWRVSENTVVNSFPLFYIPHTVGDATVTSDPSIISNTSMTGLSPTATFTYGGTDIILPPGTIREGSIKSPLILKSGQIIDFNNLNSYTGKYRGTWSSYHKKKDGDTYDYTYYFTGDLIQVTIEKMINPFVVGWKTYGVDTSKIKTSTYRKGSNKYMLYFGKGDSFKKVSSDLETFIQTNDINVKVSARADTIDDASIDIETEIDLRQLVNALPTGKIYPLNSEDAIFSDILSENKIQIAPDGGTYVILGEDTISYNKFYRDIENDPKHSEQSKAIHNKDYFKNSMGLSTYHNRTLIVPLTTFDKVGKYEIEYKATDRPSDNYRFAKYNRTSDPATLKVYVHRRPVADFDIERDYKPSLIGITLKNQSYDLDHQGEIQNGSLNNGTNGIIRDGIISSQWSYKLESQATWQSGMPTSLNYGDTIDIALTVTDLEGATSSLVKTYTMPAEIPLVLNCELKTERTEFDKNAIPASESLRLTNIIVNRALPHGIEIDLKSNDGLINQKYTEYTNSNTTTYTDANGKRQWHDIVINLPETYKDGGYRVEVKLKDLKNTNGTSYQLKTGDQVSKTLDFSITTPVKINASITAQSGNAYDLKGITGRYSKETIVKLFSGTPYEKTLSIPKISETHKSNHLLDEATWFRNISLIGADMATGTPAPTGQYIARFETKTASGNRAISEVPFDYQPVTVKSFDARGYWNHWRGQTTLKGEVTTIEPHRFLAHECVIFEALIQGEIEGALLRLSPELESMTYWDKYNNLYRYEDDFHMKVYFPVHLKKVGSTAEGDLWQYEYALPYADSTQSFENERLKPSYKATLYVIPKGVDWHGDYTTKGLIQMEIADIDITGNIHDLLYIEPVRGQVD